MFINRYKMNSKPQIVSLAEQERLNYEAYPLTMAVFRIFRAARRYRREILDKLALGSDTMLDDESEVDESFTYWAEWVDAV